MATDAQIRANRKNANRSTGPRTQAGKDRSSQNAVTHGLLAQDVILDNENEHLFVERRDAILADLNPVGELEQVLVERIVVCEWRLRRLRQIETSVFQYQAFDHAVHRAERVAHKWTRSCFSDPALIGRTVTNEGLRNAALREAEESELARDNETLAIAFTQATSTTDALSKLSRYEAAIERSMYKALHELQRLQAARAGQAVSAPAVLDVSVSTPTG
jgi:hypothetical protein